MVWLLCKLSVPHPGPLTCVLTTAQGLRRESGDRAPFLSVWGWWTWGSPLSCPLPRVSAGSLGTGRPFCLSGVGGPGGHLCLAHCPGSPWGVWGQGALFVCLGLVDLGVTSVLITAQGLRRESGDRAPFLSVWGWWTWGSPLSWSLSRVSAGSLGTGRPFCLSGGGGPGGHLNDVGYTTCCLNTTNICATAGPSLSKHAYGELHKDHAIYIFFNSKVIVDLK